MQVVVITGISGSGKSIAINVLEDDGFYCIDNLPARFLQEVISSLREAGHDRIAVSIDARSGEVSDLRQAIAGIGRYGQHIKLLFLNASTDTLVRRYSETRRRHPMAMPRGGQGSELTLVEAIEREREMMSVIEDAGVAIDTTDLPVNVLRQWIREVVDSERAPLTLLFESFAYKHGVPLNADLVFDVRCLPNPFYDARLRPLSGQDEPVAAYLGAIPSVGQMIEHIAGFLQTWLPFYIQENRSYLTVAIGCTGGQHRSVYCVEQLAERFRRTEQVLVRHRSMARRQHAA
ncbi:MAG TPA: RNase adapter RapZ [Burkholderiaceae bacterium]|nr:RNase adapter RapZ [Burkholderiaceae bacterium]